MSGDVALDEVQRKSLFVGELLVFNHFCSQNVLIWEYFKLSADNESSIFLTFDCLGCHQNL